MSRADRVPRLAVTPFAGHLRAATEESTDRAAAPVRVTCLADAWLLLREHPALTWTPPLWRHEAGGPVYRAIERNLLVAVEGGLDGHGPLVRLALGPLRDRVIGDEVDPVAPLADRDDRLDVRAETFEDAVVCLAARVVACYGDSPSGRA